MRRPGVATIISGWARRSISWKLVVTKIWRTRRGAEHVNFTCLLAEGHPADDAAAAHVGELTKSRDDFSTLR